MNSCIAPAVGHIPKTLTKHVFYAENQSITRHGEVIKEMSITVLLARGWHYSRKGLTHFCHKVVTWIV